MLRLLFVSFLLAFVALPRAVFAADPFEHGWQLDPDVSTITFLSVKKGTIAETSEFAAFSGQITENGIAQIKIALDSVDTKIDLRNVRMRFLFFETFAHPEATVTAALDPAQLADLPTERRKLMEIPVTLSLHGANVDLSPRVAVTLLDNDRVNISSIDPVILQLKDFNLTAGREKLEEAANVSITPLGIVNLNLTFRRTLPGTPSAVVAPVSGASAALEAEGEFSREACLGRFEILSRSRSVNFAPSTARLDRTSKIFLDSLYDIVSRCPSIILEIGGHTDSQGQAAWNMQLSQKRANAVAQYLTRKGIEPSRLQPVGYGETTPLVSNDTAQNRARNRRIDFKVTN